MSELAPGGGSPQEGSFDENDLFLERPTHMDQANAMARQFEKVVNSSDAIHEVAIASLNMAARIANRPITVNGPVRRHHIEVATLDKQGVGDTTVTEEFVNDSFLVSLGYFAGSQSTDEQKLIRHFGIEAPKQISSPSLRGVVQQRDLIEIPIDGNAHVKLMDEVRQPDVEFLKHMVPELMNEVDTAVLQDNTLNNKLHALIQIDLEKYPVLHEKVGDDLKRELTFYINQNINKHFGRLYHITGHDLTLAIPEKKFAGTSGGLDVVGQVSGIVVSPINPRKLALGAMIFTQEDELRFFTFDFDDSLGVISEYLWFKSAVEDGNK